MAEKPKIDEATLQTMRALVRQPPKPHDQMKIGKRKPPTAKKAIGSSRKKPG